MSCVQEMALQHTVALSHEFTCLDVCNTGRLTLPMLTELMQRYVPASVLPAQSTHADANLKLFPVLCEPSTLYLVS